MTTLDEAPQFKRTAKSGYCIRCGKRTCMAARIRNDIYPYVHIIFKCARCIKRDKAAQA